MSTPTKRILALVVFLVFAAVATLTPRQAQAAGCGTMGISMSAGSIPSTFSSWDSDNSIEFTLSGLQPNAEYQIKVRGRNADPTASIGTVSATSTAGGTLQVVLDDPKYFQWRSGEGYKVLDIQLSGQGIADDYCVVGSYSVVFDFLCGDIQVYQINDEGKPCYSGGAGSCLLGDKDTTIVASLQKSNGEPAAGVQIIINVTGESDQQGKTEADGTLTKQFSTVTSGSHTVTIELDDWGTNRNLCSASFSNSLNCAADMCKSDPTPVYSGGQALADVGPTDFKLCDQISSIDFPDQFQSCIDCIGGTGVDNKDGVWTAIGCIKREPAQIAQALIKLGLMMGGGVALLMMLVAGFILSVSQGDPKRIEDARDMVTASFMGLIFIIFSVTILQFIGFSILRIPGFGG